MLLFVVSTKDGWVDLMRRGVDARGIDLEVRQLFHYHLKKLLEIAVVKTGNCQG